jgi:hypothetical protein
MLFFKSKRESLLNNEIKGCEAELMRMSSFMRFAAICKIRDVFDSQDGIRHYLSLKTEDEKAEYVDRYTQKQKACKGMDSNLLYIALGLYLTFLEAHTFGYKSTKKKFDRMMLSVERSCTHSR